MTSPSLLPSVPLCSPLRLSPFHNVIALPVFICMQWQTELRSEKVVFTAEIHRAFDESERESLKEEKQARGVTPERD